MIRARQFFAIALLSAGLLVSGNAFGQSDPEPTEPTEESTTSEEPRSELSDEEREKYEEHLRAGKEAYANQNFDLAFTQLNKAHAIHPKPSILFNIALISEKAGALQQSADYYQKFLNAPGVSLANRKRASERLSAVNEILETSGSAEEARQKQEMTDLLPALEAMGIEQAMEEPTEPVATGSSTPSTSTSKTETTESGTSGDLTTEQTLERRPEVEYTWPIYAAFGTATAALLGGVAMVILSNDAIDEGKLAGQEGDNAGLANAEEKASMYATTAAGLFAGGAALAIVGSYFVIRVNMNAEEAARAGEPEKSASLSLAVDRDFVGSVFTLDF